MLIVCPKCATKYEIPEEMHISPSKKLKCSTCQHVFCLTDEIKQSQEVEEPKIESIPEEPSVMLKETERMSEPEAVFAEDTVFQESVPQPFVPVAPQEEEEKRSVGFLTAFLSLVVVVVLVVFGLQYKDILFEDLFVSPPPKTPAPAFEEKSLNSGPSNLLKTETKQENLLIPVKKYEEETPKVVSLPQVQSVRFEKIEGESPTIRIEGILKNTTNDEIRLPSKVRAIAYDIQGKILFEKDIYLTDKVLLGGEERPFFGSYQPAPADVQWVDVTF